MLWLRYLFIICFFVYICVISSGTLLLFKFLYCSKLFLYFKTGFFSPINILSLNYSIAYYYVLTLCS